MPVFNAEYIIGRTFLIPNKQTGEKHRARVVKALEEYDKDLSNDLDHVIFYALLIKINMDKFSNTMASCQTLMQIK